MVTSEQRDVYCICHNLNHKNWLCVKRYTISDSFSIENRSKKSIKIRDPKKMINCINSLFIKRKNIINCWTKYWDQKRKYSRTPIKKTRKYGPLICQITAVSYSWYDYLGKYSTKKYLKIDRYTNWTQEKYFQKKKLKQSNIDTETSKKNTV